MADRSQQKRPGEYNSRLSSAASTDGLLSQPVTFSRSWSRKKVVLVAIVGCLGLALILGLSIGLARRSAVPLDEDLLQVDQPVPFQHEDYGYRGVGSSAEGVFPKAAVSCDAARCSQIGSEIMARNGTVIDAAIAAHVCLGLFVPHSMGLGGGFFMTFYHRASDRAYVIDAREEAPGAATEDMYHGNSDISQKGALAAAVPGELRGLELAHKHFGRLPWEELFLPSIQLCREGVQVERALAKALRQKKDDVLKDPGLKSVFINPATGDVYQLGDIIKYPQLADTLAAISKGGADAFYKGDIGQNVVNELQSMGGIMTMNDLGNYAAILKNATDIELSDGLRMFSNPPPGSGIILSNIMLILDGYKFSPADLATDNASIEAHHRIDEAFKFAFARRPELGDERFVDQTDLIANLTSPDYANAIRAKIWDNRTFDASYYGAKFSSVDDHGTSHMSLTSPEGDAVAISSTINLYFGCGIMSPTTGLILNDEMDDFSSPNITNAFDVPPSVNNYIVPGKRPVSSMTPTIFVDAKDTVVLVTGGSGGTKITTSTAYHSIRHLWCGENVTQSVDALRIFNQLYPQTTQYEIGFPMVIVRGLAKMGHNMTIADSTAVINPIGRIPNGELHACADIRKGGNVSGF